ncbi:MAG TPA: hypothetical protein VL551_33710 [Actinospica sp.]|jgi:hypothetical protein|nr:hypothetical protein [Actinospica sp.]
MNDLIAPFGEVDWDDVESVEEPAYRFLESLSADPPRLNALLEQVRGTPELLALSEHHPDIFDKVVLHDDASGIRVRLHVFLPGYSDAPHDHRWTFASRILRGGYRHRMYGAVDLRSVPPADLAPVHVRTEQPGDHYVLHHTMVHALDAQPDTVSLVLRGPAVKSRFVVHESTGVTERVGAADEPAAAAAAKRMTPERLDHVIARLREWGVA